MKSMGYTWRAARKDVYADGHEREDVVNHRKEFVSRLGSETLNQDLLAGMMKETLLEMMFLQGWKMGRCCHS